MNTDTSYTITTSSPDATSKLGEQVAKHLTRHAVIELTSDLGGGKTTFARGLAKGLGYSGVVASPTYTISREYRLPDGRELHHYDFYRLGPDDIVASELAESLKSDNVVTIIEWANNAGDILPEDHLTVDIKTTGDTERQIIIAASGPMSTKIIEVLNK